MVATKGGVVRTGGRWDTDGRPEHLRAACDRSLRALGVERIALYQLHAPDPAVPFEESVGALAELRRAGKIRWVGLSNVSVEQIRSAEAIVPVTTVQNRLNPFFREALATGVLRYCTERGIGFLAYSPVGGGRLNRKLPDHPVLAPMARRLGVSAHVLVLAWVLAQSPGGPGDPQRPPGGARAGLASSRRSRSRRRRPGGHRSGGVFPSLSRPLSRSTARASPPA